MEDYATQIPASSPSPARVSVWILVAALATICGAWLFQLAGYLPCELCLQQRLAYYAGVPLAALTAYFALSGQGALARPGFALLALLFAGSAVFGAYHAGVEWGFWPGPTACTGSIAAPAKVGDFLKELETIQIVRCDAVAIRIAGLSLAGWNAIISAALAWLAAGAARKQVPVSVQLPSA